MGTEFVSSTDGVRIAFERRGQGPTLILVTGLLCTRRRFDALAELLSSTFTVANYDRRGRGESGDAKAQRSSQAITKRRRQLWRPVWPRSAADVSFRGAILPQSARPGRCAHQAKLTRTD